MTILTSPANPFIKDIASLHTKKGREKLGLFLAEGIRTITTVLASQKIELIYILCTERTERDAQELAPDYEVTVVSDALMKKISSASTPSGIIAVCAIPEQKTLKNGVSGVVLAEIQDPGNMGALIRTAAALNKKAVICIGGTDPWSPKVIQASAGTIGMADIINLDWDELVAQRGSDLCALVVQGGQPPEEITHKDLLLVIGSESHGLPADWIKDCPLSMTIPMPGGTESLNAAVAGSIGMYLVK